MKSCNLYNNQDIQQFHWHRKKLPVSLRSQPIHPGTVPSTNLVSVLIGYFPPDFNVHRIVQYAAIT